MAWDKEYKNFGVINWKGSKVFVHKTPNNRLEIQVGSGCEVEMASWAGNEVNVIFLKDGKRKVRKYSSPNRFTIIS